jgi:hypothetical protein
MNEYAKPHTTEADGRPTTETVEIDETRQVKTTINRNE